MPKFRIIVEFSPEPDATDASINSYIDLVMRKITDLSIPDIHLDHAMIERED